jgi:hypothetical protein
MRETWSLRLGMFDVKVLNTTFEPRKDKKWERMTEKADS